ncbi:MAG: Crp/Fnr family transcriptional regulator [Crocinitomicaceae bacterium]|nr:Crp/Fnr family transcriptional regulator [Crocinitomicaceae bacterium]
MNLFSKKYLKEWKSFVDHHKKSCSFKKGDVIFSAGDKTDGIYIIDSGFVKITYKQYDGNELLIRITGKGNVLGHRGIGGDWKYPISAYALSDLKLSFIPIDTFNSIATTNAEFCYEMMIFFANELKRSEKRISQLPVLNRIASAVLENYQVFGFDADEPNKLSFTISRNDISNMARTTYESVIRSLSELKKMGVIKLQGKSIYILDLNKLEELANPNGK